MNKIRKVIGFIAALLFSVLSAVATPMASTVSHQAEFFPFHVATAVEHINVHFAARAPPTTMPNVAVTGAAFAERGNGIIMHGHETHVADHYRKPQLI